MIKMSRVIIALVVLASGCMSNPLDGQFTADVDGKPFKAINASFEDSSSKSQIVAADIKLNILTILIPGALEEGTYTLGLITSEASATYLDLLQQKLYVSQSGTLTIISNTNEGITGTFDMHLVDIDPLGGGGTVEVVNGEFDLPRAPAP